MTIQVDDRVRAGAGLTVETTNGSVSLVLPGDFSGELSARTPQGRIALAGLGPERRQRGGVGDRAEMRLGRGGAPVRLATVNGALSIRQVR